MMVKNFLGFVTFTGKDGLLINNTYNIINILFSLIKMMYWISEKSGETLTMNQLQHCLMRNFGGKTNVNSTVEVFLNCLIKNFGGKTDVNSTVTVEVFLNKVRADLVQTKPSTSDGKVSIAGGDIYVYIHSILLLFRIMIVLCMD